MTADAGSGDAAAGFALLRPKLMRVAYRMLGSVSDAEDIVQEAFIRWMRADRGDVREPEAFLRRTVTRLCLDQLKSARRTRETYIGPWLPDPVVEEDEADDVTLPLMLVLERLSPLERAAFLLQTCSGWDSTRSRPPSSATPWPVGSSRPARAPTSATRGPVSRWKSSAASRSPRRFSPPRAEAT